LRNGSGGATSLRCATGPMRSPSISSAVKPFYAKLITPTSAARSRLAVSAMCELQSMSRQVALTVRSNLSARGRYFMGL
jgi:hypothetical protein